ncbi:MAG: hypothetical protein LQ352_005839 [Teloschistes flavicans]|nr:MAG: hypothetical protein LQ352_005839 [Teloschistes flavicans]
MSLTQGQLPNPSPTEQRESCAMSKAPESSTSTGPSLTFTLTPPSTPVRPQALRNADLEDGYQESTGTAGTSGDFENSVFPTAEENSSWESILLRPCTIRYQRLGSASSESNVLGSGAWSSVYRATELSPAEAASLPTPPSSPANSRSQSIAGQLLAVKAAARRDAHTVLYQEARVLTYLHRFPRASSYLVPFHGYDTASQSLVMDAVPLDLETHAKSSLMTAKANFSTSTMFDPVCGLAEWQSLASQLIDGLVFLHETSCVHGDIKPANILLQRNEAGSPDSYRPLYCDFSSSHILKHPDGDSSKQIQQVTAISTDFASPELLSSLCSSAATATTASDVYALAVTLLVVAIGTSPYVGARLDIQRLSMTREGRPLDFARQTEQGTRVMRGKMVEKCLKGALERNVDRRDTVGGWQRNFQSLMDS